MAHTAWMSLYAENMQKPYIDDAPWRATEPSNPFRFSTPLERV